VLARMRRTPANLPRRASDHETLSRSRACARGAPWPALCNTPQAC